MTDKKEITVSVYYWYDSNAATEELPHNGLVTLTPERIVELTEKFDVMLTRTVTPCQYLLCLDVKGKMFSRR